MSAVDPARYPRTSALVDEGAVARVDVLEECGSTNSELVSRASDSSGWPDFSVLATTSQTAGRGRRGRVWVAPPGRTLAVSVLVRPILASGEPLGLGSFGWLSLIAGVAMADAVARLAPDRSVSLKWPNDVQVDGLKVSGLLAELAQGPAAVVLGAGLNLSFTAEELPTPVSTSLTLAGATLTGDGLADAALAGYLAVLKTRISDFLRSGGDPVSSGIARLVSENCSTIGRGVRVELPGGETVLGVATGIDGSGRLEVRRSTDATTLAVAAGDVTHLRYE